MHALYRTYRPQTFADVTGQPQVTQTLAAAVASGRVAHAYLFSGPRGVGKTTTARLLAKAVSCTARSSGLGGRSSADSVEPCNTCSTCIEITEGRCLDVIEIDAASHTGVDHVRERVIETSRLAPARAPRRTFIIDEVHMLSTSAFNALLKTLEEPPAHLLFILATTELHRVPETIRSRCQHFTFRRVPAALLRERLVTVAQAERVAVDPGVFDAIVRAAGGSVRDAETMLGQLCSMGGEAITAADAAAVLPRSSAARAAVLVDAVCSRDPRRVVEELEYAAAEGFDAEAYLRDVVEELRARTRAALVSDSGARPPIAALRRAVELIDPVARHEQPFLLLEASLLELAAAGSSEWGVGSSRSPGEVDRRAEFVSNEPPRQTVRSMPHIARTAVAHEDTTPRVSHDATENVRDVATSERLRTAVRAAWSALIARLGQEHPALAYLLEGGRPQRVEGSVLTIGFRYKLHAEKVRDPRASGVVAEALAAVVGTTLTVLTAVVSPEIFAELDAATRPKTGDVVADAALEVFGGRVVE